MWCLGKANVITVVRLFLWALLLCSCGPLHSRVPWFFLCIPAFLFDILFAIPCALAFLFCVSMLLCQRVYVWGVGCDSSHVRCLCMGGSGGWGQLAISPLPPLVTRARCRSILAGSRFGVKLISLPQSPPLPPLLSVHVITLSSLHMNANLAFLCFPAFL